MDNVKIISDKMLEALQYRIREEEASARLYESMANWLDHWGYRGTSRLFSKYAGEEYDHAQWSYKYLRDLGINPVVPEIPAPSEDFESYTKLIQEAYEHELTITAQCKQLAQKCVEENDYLTFPLALKYTEEQVDEIAKISNILDSLEAYGDDPKALRLLDDELGESINTITEVG